MAKAGAVRAGRAFVELFADDSKLARGLKAAEQKFRAFGQSVQAIGANLMKAGLAVSAPFALGAKTFADFESSMARVKALTGATGADFDRLREKALELGRDTVFKSSEAAQAMSVFALAGFKTNQIYQAVGPTLDLAAAGQLGIAEAADIAVGIMKGSGIATQDLGAAIDILAKAMTTANTDIRLLGDAFKYVGPIAEFAGVQFEEITAAIQVLSDAGIKGDMAGTTLRGGILSLTKPTAEAAAMMQTLGVRVKDANGNTRQLADIIEDLEKATKGLGTADRLAVLGTLFDARQAAGFAAIVGRGSAALREMTGELKKAGGTAASIAKTQLDTLTGSWKILTSAVEDVLIQLGAAVSPMLREWGNALQAVANGLSKLIRENTVMAVSIAKWTAATIGAGAALIGLGVAAKLAAFSFGILATAMKFYFSMPVLVVRGVATIVGAWMMFSDSGRSAAKSFSDAWASIKDTAAQGWTGVVDAVMAGDLELAAKIAFAGLKVAWLELMDGMSKAFKSFTDILPQRLGNFLQMLVNMRTEAERLNQALNRQNDQANDAQRKLIRARNDRRNIGIAGGGIGVALWQGINRGVRDENIRNAPAGPPVGEADPLAVARAELQQEIRKAADARARATTTQQQRIGAAVGLAAAMMGRSGLPGAPGAAGGGAAGMAPGGSAGAFGAFAAARLSSGGNPVVVAIKQQANEQKQQLGKVIERLGDVERAVRDNGLEFA